MSQEKKKLSPTTALAPVPVVMVSSGDIEGKKNIITVAWVGTVCSEPPMVGVGIRPERYSHKLITESGEFVVNIPGLAQLEATDFCGVVSGKEVDKFTRTGLTPVPAEMVKAPLIAECPVNLECRVKQVVGLGSHDLFLGEIVRVHMSGDFEKEGTLNAVAYGLRRYYALGKVLGTYGFAAKKF